METKRKASGVNGVDPAGNDPNDRAAKRRKLQEEFGDLSNGETSESTTAYGLNILESIRATTDKNGRPVSPYFETLPTRSANPDYYKKIRLPLSLESIERKLKNHEYSKLSILESDFKRLVSNAKEINERTSVAFGDAERVRKAVSNLMVKYNPAYKSGNYQAVATPLPPTPEPDEDDDEDEEEEEEGGEDAEGEEEEDNDASAQDAQTPSKDDVEEVAAAEEEEDAEGEGEENVEDEAEDEEEDEEDDEEDDEDEEDEDGEPSPEVGKRRPGRPPKDPLAHARKVAARGPTPGKADTHYEDVSYKGLNFQQAQEKIVEELLRRKDDSGEFPYFEPFIYLPPRSLKDYYEIIAEPLSLKALQKQVRGQHGRGGATYVSDFKGWAAFEDQASLMWKNAYHYNEDGSEISLMAQELEQVFRDEVKQAKLHVPEPPQPKIKLKIPPNSEAPVHPKKITIHVGGKTSATGSPAPVTSQSGEGDFVRSGTPMGRNPFGGSTATSVSLSQLEKARSMSASAGPPSPSAAGLAKPEETLRPSPAFTNHQQFAPPVMPPSTIVPNGVVPPPVPVPKLSAADILEAQKYRPRPIKESEALIPKLVITSHPSLQLDSRLSITIPASPTETQQELVFNAPASHFRLQLRPQIAPFLEAQQREWKLNVIHDSVRLYPSSVPFDKRSEPVFDTTLRYGINRLEVSLVAALPKGEKAPNGLNMELEKFVIHFNLLRQS
ncbi:Bromodomain-containing protein [Hypoxylon rubiginosum]|uniref:Bromodomain-containing protein n=1 Tax=Hypoxylon rubiginosum TaxID=110542 RepID=A0ACB9Z0J3_9PEZI|nr:Bromodomain-containing protein [Hypoxylon rubiginosum]